MAFDLRRVEVAATAKPGKTFYPQALVGLTAFMETMRPNEGLEQHVFFGGAVRKLRDTVMVAVKPQAVRVVRNSYQKPDSFHVEFDARALPMTPKQIRACSVDVYLWNAPYIGAEVPKDAQGNLLLEPVITGLVDDVTSRMGADGHVVQVDGQDYTALFSQREWSTKKTKQKRQPMGLRLDIQLEQLIREGDPGGVMRLKIEPETLRSGLPIVGAAARRTNKKGKPVPEKSSWWDVMYRMAQQEGFILFVDGLDVVLTKPHVLHAARAGVLGGVEPERPVFHFAWGRNLETLELQRHLGKERTPVIEVRSYDERTRQTLEGRYPAKDQTAPTGVGTNRDQVQVYQMPGITQERALREAARTVYELIAKGEQKLSATTSDLMDLDGNDVLSMRSGDAFVLDVDVYNTEQLMQLPEATRRARLLAAGFPDEVAAFVALNMEVVDQMRGPWRCSELTLDYGLDGVEVSFEGQEYVILPDEA